jgi:hypothetical protein
MVENRFNKALLYHFGWFLLLDVKNSVLDGGQDLVRGGFSERVLPLLQQGGLFFLQQYLGLHALLDRRE